MGQLAIMVIVDVALALKDKTLDGHIYLMDNNTFGGSTGQGTDKLVTHVEGMQVMNWLVSRTDLYPMAKGVSLEDIRGEAVRKQVMVPSQFESPAPGVRMTFKANVLIKAAFSNATVKPIKVGGL
jgi:hypothetical protein